jgi:hypothetical protein
MGKTAGRFEVEDFAVHVQSPYVEAHALCLLRKQRLNKNFLDGLTMRDT